MRIEILGTGCAKCHQLAANARAAVAELGLNCAIEEVREINRILGYGVMLTPALVLDGQVKSMGKVLSVREVRELLR